MPEIVIVEDSMDVRPEHFPVRAYRAIGYDGARPRARYLRERLGLIRVNRLANVDLVPAKSAFSRVLAKDIRP
jgi:hypothetical protein